MPKYEEGDWFAVPLRTDGFALGLLARSNPNGALLGYFFGPRRIGVPTLDAIVGLAAVDAILVGTFGHLGLKQGKWAVVGRAEPWARDAWPMPVFVRYEELTGRTFHVFYDPDDPARLVREEQVSPGLAEHGPTDGLMGAGFVELRLTRLLDGG